MKLKDPYERLSRWAGRLAWLWKLVDRIRYGKAKASGNWKVGDNK